MTDRRDVDATELHSVVATEGGRRLRLRVSDQSGQTVRFSLPANWLNSVLSALPRCPDANVVHPLDSWSIEHAPNGKDLILTLRTPQGRAVCFAVKSWQIEGMATLATYGDSGAVGRRTVH